MRIDVEYFAATKALVGVDHDSFVDVPEGITFESFLVRILARHPVLGPHVAKLRLVRNDEFVAASETLADGDTVGLLPPLAGGSGPEVTLAEVSGEPLSIDRVFAAVMHPGAGGVAVFVGVVRDQNDGRGVSRLEYEAHPRMAENELRRVLEAIMNAHPGSRVAAVHRVGALAVGDLAVVVAASAPHRGVAFDACRAAIDAIKDGVPIWKRELDEGGSPFWIGM